MKNAYMIGAIALIAIAGLMLYFFNKQRNIVDMSKTQTVETNIDTTEAAPSPEVTQGQESVTQPSGISMSELAKHSSETDCWVGVDGSVYDVTSYIGKHPGGPAILQGCGKDASDLFSMKHGQKQRELLEKFKIGTLQQ